MTLQSAKKKTWTTILTNQNQGKNQPRSGSFSTLSAGKVFWPRLLFGCVLCFHLLLLYFKVVFSYGPNLKSKFILFLIAERPNVAADILKVILHKWNNSRKPQSVLFPLLSNRKMLIIPEAEINTCINLVFQFPNDSGELIGSENCHSLMNPNVFSSHRSLATVPFYKPRERNKTTNQI